jgi:phage terminase large subunit-like protein
MTNPFHSTPVTPSSQSWDCVYKPGEHNDYSACSTWRLRANNEQVFLIDDWRDRVDFRPWFDGLPTFAANGRATTRSTASRSS